MLSIKNIAPAQGVNYFKQENYYSQEEAKRHSQWSGQGAANFKLSGPVNSKAFQNLLEGYSPERNQVLTGKANKKNHRAAYDCTFSAPKSISLAALMGGQDQLIQAHQRAVERTLKIIEQQYAQARVWDGEKQHRVDTGNLIVAQFHHTTSREKDPQLHTHCVIINATQLPDGRWRALSNEELYRNKMLLGAIYRNELAQECRKLGYEIEKRPQELFEIKGYTQQQLEHFSKRRQHIEKLVGLDATAEEKQWAALYQRPPKGKELSVEELQGWWQAQDEAIGLGIQHPVPQAQQFAPAVEPGTKVSPEAAEAVKVAVEHCSERTVAFKRQAIEKFVLSEIKHFNYADLQRAIANSPELIKTFDKSYTTQKALDRELATIRLMLQGKGQVEAIATPETVEAVLEMQRVRLGQENKRLTQGQQEAVRLAATTQDQFVAWSGVAGSGKTYSLKLLKSIAEAQGYTVKGFAPSGAAAKVLGTELEMEAKTVASLLVSKQPEQVQPKQLWIVDEAGLLNARDGYKLLKRAREEGAQITMVGDYRQNSAVEAGSPFRSLLSAGIATAYMNESLRQKNPEIKQAADLAAAGHHLEALTHISSIGRIQLFNDQQERTGAIAQEYLQLTPQERSQTLILAGTHKEKGQIMHSIRAGLKAEGTLSQDEIPITRLKSKDLSSVQNRYVHHYQVGDVVVPVREYRRSGLHKNQPYCVEAIEKDKLLLSDLVGNRRLIDPMKFRKSVYQQETLELAVGDRLKWTKANKELGHINGEEFTVTALEDRTATIAYEDGRTDSLYLDQPLHLDYALVSTTYSSQGKTADRALISSTIDQTVSQESVYVALSRTRHELKIFAEDTDFLMAQAQESGVQRNPVELLERKAEPQTKEKVSVTQAVMDAPTKEAASPVKGYHQPQQQAPVQTPALQVGVKAPASKPPLKPVKAPTQPAQKPPTPKLQKKPPASRSQPKPQQLQPFWTPEHVGPPPFHIEEKHWRELVEGSAIHPELATVNVETVAGNQVYERLLSTKLEQIGGSGQYVTQPAAKLMKAYEQVAEGGWWAKAGIDARSLPHLQPGEEPDIKLWGSFKPDNPRVDATKSQRKGKTEYIKYEHPLAEERQLFLFDVQGELAQRIYDKHGIDPTEPEKQSGFWSVVHKYNLPITVTEGAKKTLSSLSQGEITIGFSGINGGYFAKDKDKNPLNQRILHPELEVFATPGREFRFAFDHDTKASTVFNVRRDMVRTGELLEQEGCSVRVVQWKGNKGLDDLIVNQGPLAYTKAQANPIPLAWEAQKHYRGEYTRLSRQARKAQPGLSGDALDAQVYRLAVEKGDIRDGDRVIAQSDQARSLRTAIPQQEADARTLEYIQHIEQQIYQSTTQIQQTPNERTEQPTRTLDQREPYARTSRGPSTTAGAHRAPGAEVGALPAGANRTPSAAARELSQGLDAVAELQEVERLAEAVKRLNQCLGKRHYSVAGAENLRRSLERHHSALAAHFRQSEARDLLTDLADSIERSAVEEAPHLSQALESLTAHLEHPGRSDTRQAIEQLTASVSSYAQELTAHIRQSQIKALVDYVEESVIVSEPELAQALEKLTSHLEHHSQPGTKEILDNFNLELAAQVRQLRVEALQQAIASYAEHSAVEAQPNLSKALQKLTSHLEHHSQPETKEAVEQLTATVSNYTQELEAKSLPLFNLADHADSTQWPRVKQSLLEQYLLPKVYVDDLYNKGIIGADHQGRAMFIRYAMNEKLKRGKVLGAELHDASVSQGGHFWLQFGQGEPRRVLITSTPLDALSLAALDQRQYPTLYLAVNGNGAIPTPQLQHFLKQDAQVVVALNTDQKALAQQLLKQWPKAIQRQPAQGNTWNEQLQFQRTQALYQKYSNEGQRPDLVGITRNAIEDGCSRELVAKILSHHPAFAAPMEQQGLNATVQHLQNPPQQGVEEQQQPQAPQPVKLSSQQLWQQYSQWVQPGGRFTTALEVARLAWKEGVPEAEIRQILQGSPHLQQFGEKGRRDLVELPLAKVKREAALSKLPLQEPKQQERPRRVQDLGPQL